MSQCISLEGQKQTVNGEYSELAVSPSVSFKINGLWSFLGTVDIVNFDSFWTP
jgi:hypothetical protein